MGHRRTRKVHVIDESVREGVARCDPSLRHNILGESGRGIGMVQEASGHDRSGDASDRTGGKQMRRHPQAGSLTERCPESQVVHWSPGVLRVQCQRQHKHRQVVRRDGQAFNAKELHSKFRIFVILSQHVPTPCH